MANPIFPTPFPRGFRLISGDALNRAFQLDGPVSSQDGITASIVQTLAGGTPIVTSMNRVTVANANDAVTLLGPGVKPQAGTQIIIANTSGQTIGVFPPGASDTLDAGGAGAVQTLASGKTKIYFCVAVSSAGVATWVTILTA